MSLPTVPELIHARLQDKSTPGTRKDPYKLAVVAEDGSMRWVVAAGFLSRLEAHGIQADIIVGTSGGGLTATYYAAGHTREGVMVLRHLSTRGFNLDNKSPKFLETTRMLRSKPAMDIEGAVDIVFTHKIPLNFAALKNSKVPTYLTATTRTGETILQPLHGQSPEAIRLAMKNTARVPVIGHSPRDASVMWDGGLKAGLPVTQALSLGATHILAIRCKDSMPFTFRQKINAEEMLVKPVLFLLARDLFHLLCGRGHHTAHTLSLLAQGLPHMFTLGLPHVKLHYGETSEAKLFRQLVEAWHHAGKALNLPEIPLPADWQPEAAKYL